MKAVFLKHAWRLGDPYLNSMEHNKMIINKKILTRTSFVLCFSGISRDGPQRSGAHYFYEGSKYSNKAVTVIR